MTHERIARHGNLRASPRKGVFRTSLVLVSASKGRKPTVIEFFCSYTYYLFGSHFAHQSNRLLCHDIMIIGPDKHAHSPQHTQTQHKAHKHMHTIFWLFTLQLHTWITVYLPSLSTRCTSMSQFPTFLFQSFWNTSLQVHLVRGL